MIGLLPAFASSAPIDDALPEIARIKAVTRPCSAMRDLALPAYAAIRDADARFRTMTVSLASLAENSVSGGPSRFVSSRERATNDPIQERDAFIAGQQLATMMQDLVRVSDALGDPRLSTDSPNTDLQTERTELTRMYEIEAARSNLLFEFLMRRSTNVSHREATALVALTSAPTAGRSGVSNPRSETASDLPTSADPDGRPAAVASIDSRPIGFPQISSIGFVAKRQMTEWANEIAAQVATTRNLAVRALVPIANGCVAPPAPSAETTASARS